MGFPIAQQLPARHQDGRCLILGFEGDRALVVETTGLLTYWPISELTVEWHYNTQTGTFEPDFPEEYSDEETDQLAEVP